MPANRLRETLTRPVPGVASVMLARHHELEAGFEQLFAADVTDPHQLASRWLVLDAELRDHLAVEEDLIIPAFQLSDPEEADALRTEHARIRELLDYVGVDVRHHAIHRDRLLALIELLRAHATHEDASMYPWAERNLSRVAYRQLYLRLSHWLRRRASRRVMRR